MNPEARAVVDLVAGGTPVCNADMTDLHPDMSSAAAEIYASSIALAEFLHITYVNEEMGFGKIKPINILVDNSTAIAFAKCASKRTGILRMSCCDVLFATRIAFPPNVPHACLTTMYFSSRWRDAFF